MHVRVDCSALGMVSRGHLGPRATAMVVERGSEGPTLSWFRSLCACPSEPCKNRATTLACCPPHLWVLACDTTRLGLNVTGVLLMLGMVHLAGAALLPQPSVTFRRDAAPPPPPVDRKTQPACEGPSIMSKELVNISGRRPKKTSNARVFQARSAVAVRSA